MKIELYNHLSVTVPRKNMHNVCHDVLKRTLSQVKRPIHKQLHQREFISWIVIFPSRNSWKPICACSSLKIEKSETLFPFMAYYHSSFHLVSISQISLLNCHRSDFSMVRQTYCTKLSGVHNQRICQSAILHSRIKYVYLSQL